MFRDFINFVKQLLGELGFDALIKNESWQVDSIILLISLGILGSLLTTSWRLILLYIRKQRQK